eukprot:CAMPEP_0115081700 /NCGR_PEP_ID=MMETSP0227-20121206/19442_1 /TAXON_ID=89957 /ORGANISM="Polarella glacialis, Strain CCMP 1383" /LENGTH=93 /DNA_ID=CAMNT_0002469609 /DNA_START=262 /DNA_END=543 /DNA_ORIENTATION=-
MELADAEVPVPVLADARWLPGKGRHWSEQGAGGHGADGCGAAERRLRSWLQEGLGQRQQQQRAKDQGRGQEWATRHRHYLGLKSPPDDPKMTL